MNIYLVRVCTYVYVCALINMRQWSRSNKRETRINSHGNLRQRLVINLIMFSVVSNVGAARMVGFRRVTPGFQQPRRETTLR